MKREEEGGNPHTHLIDNNANVQDKHNVVSKKLEPYSFCKLYGKKPFENDWQAKPYKYYDRELQDWIKQGHNYGCMGGYGGLWPWDFDNLEARRLLLEYLPDTFQVKSRRGSHHYFRSNEKELFTAGVNFKGSRAIDITGFGRQVVGPGSVHPESHKPYFVISDIEIAYLDAKEARKLLHDVLGWEAEETSAKIPRPQGHNDRIWLTELVDTIEPYWNVHEKLGRTYNTFQGSNG